MMIGAAIVVGSCLLFLDSPRRLRLRPPVTVSRTNGNATARTLRGRLGLRTIHFQRKRRVTTPPNTAAVVTNAAGNVTSNAAVLTVVTCAAIDSDCDGIDDDCNGTADEEFRPYLFERARQRLSSVRRERHSHYCNVG